MPDAALTPEELAARTRLATEAAFSAATDLDLRVEDTTVLHDAFSVVVHLEPSPVVARIPVVLPAGTTVEEVQERQWRELDVASWLAREGVPAVRPSPLVPAEPVLQDDFSITFWELVELAPDHQPYAGADPAVCAALHAALATYPGVLPFLAPMSEWMPKLMDSLEGCPHLSDDDLDRAHAEWHALRPTLTDRRAFAERFPSVDLQPIQGDAPSHNVIRSTSGLRFADFELVSAGPIEWDMAGQGAEAVAAYDAAAGPLGLRTCDPDLMPVMDAAARLYGVAALALAPQLPLLGEHAEQTIAAWRAAPMPVL